MRDRSLVAVLSAFTVTVTLLFLSSWASIKVLSGVRAYVGGEGLYSKAQKNAVYDLALYAASGNEQWYQAFDKSLKVPEGDRDARLELQRPHPDVAVVRRGFIQGGNSPADVRDLMFVFQRMARDPYVHKAISIWTEADPEIAQLRALGQRMHDLRRAQANPAAVRQLMPQVEALNQSLTVLEDDFSYTLGEGARSASTKLLLAFLLLSVALWGTGVATSWRLVSALTRERETLRATIENAPLGVVLADAPTGKIRMSNSHALELLGPDSQTYVSAQYGDRWQTLDAKGAPLAWAEYPIAKALKGDVVRNRDLQWLRRDGAAIWLRVGAAPIQRGGKVCGAVATFYDITEERRVEEELVRKSEELARSNADLEQFAYTTSHDLQEPLRNIALYTQLLARHVGALDDNTGHLVEVIRAGVERMSALITDLLAYSRVSNLNASPMARVDLNEAVEWAASNLKTKIEENGARLTVGQLPSVVGDRVQLAQVFQNLVENAIKYRGAEPPAIDIRAERRGSEWLVAVKDNGIGIAPQYQGRVFGLFKRLHGRSVPGTGIGLALAKRVVERHGGRIWVTSELDRGACFTFALPVGVEEGVAAGERADDTARLI